MNSNFSSATQDETVHPAAGYAGDVSPQLAWLWVQSGHAIMVDVRTDAERDMGGSGPRRTCPGLEAVAGHGHEPRI